MRFYAVKVGDKYADMSQQSPTGTVARLGILALTESKDFAWVQLAKHRHTSTVRLLTFNLEPVNGPSRAD